MAYNYFPMGYQPMQYQQPQQQQSYTQSMIWVQGEAAAKSYPIAPNSSVPLWDSEANVIYIKSADMSGIPSMKILDYSIRENVARKPEIDAQSDFATKNDVLAMKNEIEALKAKFERLTATEVNNGE